MKTINEIKRFVGTSGHQGTIDATKDHFEITSIEVATKKVLVNFSYKQHGLHHHFFVEDITNAAEIKKRAEEEYLKYKADIDRVIVSHPDIPQSVHDLLGVKHQ